MASIFRPSTTRPIPQHATPVKGSGGKKISWKSRTGDTVIATLTTDGTRCRTKSPVWWIEYRDKDGRRRRVPGSRLRSVAELMRAKIVQQVEESRSPFKQAAPAGGELLETLAADYRDHLRDLGRSEKHYEQVYAQITDAAETSAICR